MVRRFQYDNTFVYDTQNGETVSKIKSLYGGTLFAIRETCDNVKFFKDRSKAEESLREQCYKMNKACHYIERMLR